jgi:hypothetical protein
MAYLIEIMTNFYKIPQTLQELCVPSHDAAAHVEKAILSFHLILE